MGFFLFHPCPRKAPACRSSAWCSLVRAWVCKALRLFVERESAKCHRDFCPLALQALPATGAESLWPDPQANPGARCAGVCGWAMTFPKQTLWVTWFDGVERGAGSWLMGWI